MSSSSETIASHYKNSFAAGVKAGLPIAIGYLPIALTFGLLSKNVGLMFTESLSMSVFVFAGAAQFMALQMIALGASGIEMILATFIVNIRHLLMSASINEQSAQDPLWQKCLYAFGITDETFSVAALYKGEINSRFMGGLILMAYGSWVANTALGFLIGSSLPQVIQDSMGIALYAMFIGLAVPSLKKGRKYIALFAAAAVINSILSLIPALSLGWAIVLSTLISSVGIEIFTGRRRRE